MALLERLEEIYLIRCSLLPDEIFSFLLDEQATREWVDILEKKEYLDLDEEYLSTKDLSRCQFEVNVISAQISFLVSFPSSYPGESLPEISVKGDYLSRSDQQRWQSLIEENLDEFLGTEYVHVSVILLYIVLIKAAIYKIPSVSTTFFIFASTSP